MGGFLGHLKVLDFSDQRGLLAGWMLARLGADVVAIEPAGGSSARRVDAPDDASAGFVWGAYASSKRSVCCDFNAPRGVELMRKLIGQADVLIESAGNGVMDSLGLGYAGLAEQNPRLIYASITAFGARGPDADKAASDLTVWARAGTLHPSRDNHNCPLRIGSNQAFLHAAADAAAAVLVACAGREKSGRGQFIDISAQQSASIATLSVTLAAAVNHQDFQMPADAPKKKKSLDLSGSGSRTRRSKWPVQDGLLEMHLGMGPASGGSSNKLFAWMVESNALPEKFHGWDWIKLPGQILDGSVDDDAIDEARAAVAAFLSGFRKDDLMAVAMQRGILMAPAMTMADIAASDHHEARGFLRTVRDENLNADIRLPGRFALGADAGFAPPRSAPLLGEHTDEVCSQWLGLSPGELSSLRATGALS